MAYVEKVVHLLSRGCDRIAQAAVMAMVLLNFGEISLRSVWQPIPGTYDYVPLIGVIIISFALAYCAVVRGHTLVELVVARLPQRVQSIIGSFTGILSLGIFTLITWQCFVFADDMRQVGETSWAINVPLYPFMYCLAFGVALLSAVILVDLGKSLSKAVRG